MENETDEQEANLRSHASLVDTFIEITSSSQEEAQFFLESHNFDLDSAVSTFLETSSAPVSTPATATLSTATFIAPRRDLSPTQSQSYSPSGSASSSPSRSRSPSPPPHLRAYNNEKKPYNLRSRQLETTSDVFSKRASGSGKLGGGIRTLSDLNRRDDSSSESDDDPQEYFTGGEKSGMRVQDPSLSDVGAIFKQAREAGAVEGPSDHFRSSSASRSFTGTPRLLSGGTVSFIPEEPEVVTHNIVFWANGFTVDDGPLRRLDDPENASFLESIKKSERPKELEPTNRSTAVHVNLTRRAENFPVPQRRRLPFQGVGRTLGSTASEEPNVVTNSLNIVSPPSVGLVVDENLPSTSIQLRLADGSRMVSRFNYHHTIRDIRASIDSSRPGGSRAYQLRTVGFPPKQLTDMDQTIEHAGLANSVVIQKL